MARRVLGDSSNGQPCSIDLRAAKEQTEPLVLGFHFAKCLGTVDRLVMRNRDGREPSPQSPAPPYSTAT